ncbi:MAG TPA: GspMb/PilO family protein [Armatimonadota bacterium]|nr:GspMb/PilO family protein [Armatimonadota bacterium]HOS42161.1 GspMb/PilO family protein [Armatimonadota bacterium]
MTTALTRMRRMVGTAVVLVLALAALLGYQYWAAGDIARADATARDAIARATRDARQRAAALEGREALVARIPARAQTWSWSEHLPATMTQVGALAESCGAAVATMQPAPPVTRAGVTRFPLRLKVTATLSALTTLLRRAREATPLLAVDQVTIRPGEQPGDPLRVELTLSSYVMADGRTSGGKP